jgi:hypothetical protein
MTDSASGSPTASSSEGGSAGGARDQSSVVLQVAAAVATGIGILGFVTFFGGAILWIRAKEAGLPGNEVVAVVPKGVLVTTGASFLVPAVLLALLAVGVIYAIHLGVTFKRRLFSRVSRKDIAQRRSDARQAALHAESQEQLARSRSALADAVRAALTRATERAGDDPAETETLQKELERRNNEAQEQHREAAEARAEADALAVQLGTAEAELDRALGATPWLGTLALEWLATGFVLVLIPLVGVNWFGFDLGVWPGIVLAVVAVAVAVVSLLTYLTTEKFLWFGVVAFVSVGVFIALATYFRTIDDPKVEAAAVLRDDRPPSVGVFLAQTADSVYLGTFVGGRGERRLLVIPRSHVTDFAIGPLLSPERTERRALALALDLCNQNLETPTEETSGDRGGSSEASCTPGEAEAIRTRLAVAETTDSAARATQVVAAFTRPPTMHHKVPRRGRDRPLCLVRYEEQASDYGHPSGRWWTVCREADRFRSIARVRERLGLPERFQKLIDYRLRAEVPPGERISYLRGRVAPTCEGPGDRPPCYAGGATQYWFFEPAQLGRLITRTECPRDPADEPPQWKAC